MRWRDERWARWWLVPLALVLLLPGNNLLPLIDRDEPRFAEATREMIQRGEWIVPYFNDEYRFDKPILIYWLMRISYAAFGVNEFAARLPSVVCATLLVWFTFHIGTRWFSARTGLAAAFGLLTCIQLLVIGRSAVADMPMVLCVLLAHYALFELLNADPADTARRWFVLLYVAMGIGFLAKGPVAIVLPALTLLLYRFVFWRRPVPWQRLRLGWGVALMLAIIAAWGIPALIRTHGEFLRVGVGEHVVRRGVESFQGHGSWALHYYFVAALFSLFPWIGFAGGTVTAVRRQWNAKNAFLLAWVAGTYLLFTFYRTKLPHYVMPAFPALFLMFGQITQVESEPGRWARAWRWTVHVLASSVAVAALACAVIWKYEGSLTVLRGMLVCASGIILSLSLLALCWQRVEIAWSAVPLAALIAMALVVGQGLRSITPATQFRDLFEPQPPETTYASYRFGEPSLVFYTGKHWQRLSDASEAEAFLAMTGPRVLVCEEREVRMGDFINKLQGKPASLREFSEELAPLDAAGAKRIDIDGLNLARASWVSLRVYYRTGSADAVP